MSKDKEERVNPAKVIFGDFISKADNSNNEIKYSLIDMWGCLGGFFLIFFVIGMIFGAEAEKWLSMIFGVLCLICYYHYKKHA